MLTAIKFRMIEKLKDMHAEMDRYIDELGDLHTQGVVDGWEATLSVVSIAGL